MQRPSAGRFVVPLIDSPPRPAGAVASSVSTADPRTRARRST
ncbi:hypothetical protein [Deinococcus sonorensis]|uniref:Uncharacterized protein n=2 Tax=Deinococcus sonorensis TaxID=309891 RepID=A0AAU7U6M9_9DEIO